MIGSRLGSYEITARIGEGGMGVVYKAKDSHLGREVALKVLPEGFTEDAERLARFEREAKLLASLNHPNIAQIYGLETSGGSPALVMELVEGPTLADRLAQGSLSMDESLSIARQIAEALEEAHEKGIIHRDLKPQNVKASTDGKVKVLDFGLAKAMDPAGAISGAGSASELAKSPTLTMGATARGMILGTAGYMAPEQAKALAVDKRADIWAFGVVLYEMLCGGALFTGETAGDTLAAVIRAEIDLDELPAETPFAIRQLLRRCLERSPKNRLHDIADARIVLDEVLAGKNDDVASRGAASLAPPVARRKLWPLLAAAVTAGILAGALLVGVAMRGAAGGRPAPRLTRFAVQAPEGTGLVRGLAMSPDGRKIAFAARSASGRVSLYVRSLDALEPRELPQTEGARYPFWAPDSRRIGFFAGRNLEWIDSESGLPLTVAPTSSVQDVRGGAWGADDTILFAPTFTGPIYSVRASGGPTAPATRLPEDHSIGTTRFPNFLPDGRRFVYYASAGTGTEPGSLYLGRLGSLDAKLLGPAHSTAMYAAPGYLLYARGETLVAHRFDDAGEKLVGEPISLGVSMGGSLAVSGLRSISVAADGALVYRSDKRNDSQLVWVDRAGREVDALTDASSAWHYAPRLSPDGRSVLVGQYQGQGNLGEIWLHDVARKLATRITFDKAGDDYLPAWIRPGSREFLYNSPRPDAPGAIYRASLDRPNDALPWLAYERSQIPDAVTPDGKRVVVERTDEQGRSSLWIRDLGGETEAKRLTPPNEMETSADVSPDGRWIAYSSDATRSWEVYVRRLDGSGPVVRISNEGGHQPLWRRDGRELFYVDENGHLVAVPMKLPMKDASVASDTIQPGIPQILFDARLEESTDRQYDAAADGQRFLLNRSVVNDRIPIVAVLDWRALLPRPTS
jgi:Tol biopolymer transport system component